MVYLFFGISEPSTVAHCNWQNQITLPHLRARQARDGVASMPQTNHFPPDSVANNLLGKWSYDFGYVWDIFVGYLLSIFRVFPECFGYFWGDSLILNDDVRGDPPAGWWLLAIICPEYSLPQVLVVNIFSVFVCKCGPSLCNTGKLSGKQQTSKSWPGHMAKNKSGDRPLQPGHAYLQLMSSFR